MSERFVAIGHITLDKGQAGEKDRLGGGVSYSAVAAKRLGSITHIITKCPPDHPYIGQLKDKGVEVHVLPSKSNGITTFENIYDSRGKRQQVVTEKQEPITIDDYYSTFPLDILNDATVLVAPVIGEVDSELFSQLTKTKLLGLSPQGYFRGIDPDGRVYQKIWSDSYKYLRKAGITILSEEDITINNALDKQLLKIIVEQSFYTALTKGDQGVTHYLNGEVDFETGAFTLRPEEIGDFTGAGDVFAGALLTELMKNDATLKTASVNATFFSALKIMKKAGKGIDSMPTYYQLRDYKKKNPDRIREFLKREKVKKLTLFRNF